MYAVNGRCNTAIEVIPQTNAPVEKISRYNSEAKGLRAIMYYYLMMAYNTAPLVLETINPGDKEGLLVADASRQEIYTAMIADLEGVLGNNDFTWEKDLI